MAAVSGGSLPPGLSTVRNDSDEPEPVMAMADLPQARQPCEHYWAYHVNGRLSVRLCQLCHEPDWTDLEHSLDDAQRNGRAFERADIVQLAVELSATYQEPCDDRTDHADGPHSHPLPFADRLTQLPADWPAVTP